MAWKSIDPKAILMEKIRAKGGWVNAHTHFDRSFIVNWENWGKIGDPLHMKWDHPDEFKSTSTVSQIVGHMSRVIDNQLAQGVQAIGSFVDCDSVVKDKNLRAVEKLKERYKDAPIQIKLIHQPIKGLMDPTERKWFEEAASFVDILGGLPERDGEMSVSGIDRRDEHLDILFETAKKYGGKMLHVHVDQLNSPAQRTTELLIKKTKQHGYQGKVVAVHSISVGSQPKGRRQKICKGLAEQDITVLACPTAWIDNSWILEQKKDIIGPIHNAVTPIHEMLPAGVRIAIGTDDIADIYKPFSDGDMWTELRTLLEATHTYDIDTLAEIATTNGLFALGIKQ